MKPRLADIHSICLSAGYFAIFRLRKLVHSTIFHLTGLDIDDSFLALIWIGMYFSEQLCLAVSLISTAANSAWNGEFRVKCRQGCAGTVVGWHKGTCGKREGLHSYTCYHTCKQLQICSSWLCFLLRMIHQRPTHVMSRESSEWFKCIVFYYYWLYSCNTTIN